MDIITKLLHSSGFYSFVDPSGAFLWGNLVMIILGAAAIYIAVKKDYEPLLLVPIGFGMIAGNIPYLAGLPIGVYDVAGKNGCTSTSVFSYLYYGVTQGIFPPLIFLGIGAITDFTALISNPKYILLGAAAQIGIFITFAGAIMLGFTDLEAAAIGIIGGADGPTSIFLAGQLAPHLIGPIAIAGYSYIAMIPIIQPFFMKLLITEKECRIRMKPSRTVTKVEKTIFPIMVFIISSLVSPGAITLIGMLCLGNLLKENGHTDRLAKTSGNAILDMCTIILAFCVGASTQATVFLRPESLKIFALGLIAFSVATSAGLIFAKVMNVWFKFRGKDLINPLIGAAGVSAVPDSARVAQIYAQKYDKGNFILMHAMGPNVAGVIGSAIAAGIFLSIFKFN